MGSNIFCVPKLSGIINIDNNSIILNSDQYKIFRDGSSTNLTITNYNGFVISIDNVTKNGQYKAQGIVFNNPAFADCEGSQCNEVNIDVKTIGNVGEAVIVTLNGRLNGLNLSGSFNNKLSN